MTEHKTIPNIWTAFLEAQKEFKSPGKNAANKHFGNTYADLLAVIEAVKPALNKHGIALSQPVISNETGNFVRTILYHPASGTSIEEDVPLLMGKQDMQQLKASSTYAKRIGLENITGVASADDDDDAETERKGNSMGAALNDAWKQSVEDSIPAGATPQQRAKAYADAICEDFKGKGEKALQNRWNKHRSIIENMQGRFPELHGQIVDLYENEMMRATGNDTSQYAAQ
ncbi:ERF family protein [Roseovarius sp.]|uniref:ERF family protein n=1 Tax=Roseovarius sp. TaxID=1486281 RepID=UPI003BAC0F62